MIAPIDVVHLQATQQRIVSTMLASLALQAQEDSLQALDADYMETVTQLEDALGAEALCSKVDVIAWEAYTAAYREKNGKDAPYTVTRSAAIAFLREEDQP